ncbi:hypothetical protein ACH3XW_1795 [Acanthocheilonema viteae]
MAPTGQSASWCDVLCCCICSEIFSSKKLPVNLACGHTICYNCLKDLNTNSCPLDQAVISLPFEKLPPNLALLSVLSEFIDNDFGICQELSKEYRHIESTLVKLASYLHPVECLFGGSVWSDELSRPMQRKLVSLLCYQLMEYKGLQRALKTARALAERALSELIIYHQDNSNISTVLWSAIRSRGCQFLGPAMQEEVLKLILLILSEGALMSRKTLVLYIVQALREDYPQVSKTCVGHVVQLLYRASCFNVLKREGESSLMQLKTQFRDYDALRRKHDAQIVQIAFEHGLRISPDQWSALLYGDQHHKSHMQSIIDKLQSTQGFKQQINDLKIAVEQSSDREMLALTFEHFERFANFNYLNELLDLTLAVDLFDSLLFIIKAYVKFTRARKREKFVFTSRYIRPNICRQRDRNYKTHSSRNFSILGDYVCPTDLQCMHTSTRNGFHASIPQIQSHALPVVLERIPIGVVSLTAVPQLQIAELPSLTNASTVCPLLAVGNNDVAALKKSSVSGSAGLPVGVTPIFPVPSLSLQISPARFGYISESNYMSYEVCPMKCKIPMELSGLSQMQNDIHLVKCDSYIQSGYEQKNNVMKRQQLVFRRQLQCLKHTESTADESADQDDLQSHVSCTVTKSVLYEDKEIMSTKSLQLPSISLQIASSTEQRNNSMEVTSISTALSTICPVLSRMSSTIPASVQAPCTIVRIKNTMKQPLRTSCIQQLQSLEIPSDSKCVVSDAKDKIVNVEERVNITHKKDGIVCLIEEQQLKKELNIACRQFQSLNKHMYARELKAADKKVDNISL